MAGGNVLGLQNRCAWNGGIVPRLRVRLLSAAALRQLLHCIVLVHSRAMRLRTHKHTRLVCIPCSSEHSFPLLTNT